MSDIASSIESLTDNSLFRLVDTTLNFVDSLFQSVGKVTAAGKAVNKKIQSIHNRIYSLVLQPKVLAKELQSVFSLTTQFSVGLRRQKLSRHQVAYRTLSYALAEKRQTELSRDEIKQLVAAKRTHQIYRAKFTAQQSIETLVNSFEGSLNRLCRATLLLNYGHEIAQALNPQGKAEKANGIELIAKQDVTRYLNELQQYLDEMTLEFADKGFWASYNSLNQFRLVLISDLRVDGFKLVGQAESVEQLRTIRPTEHGQRILVKSYYAGGTTGGGEFVADLQDLVTPDDGGTCFIVEQNGGRWKRVNHTTLFDYGVLGGNQNDTNAFNRLEQHSKLIYIDLQGKSYRVDKIPRNKIYFNGTFLCNDQSLALGQTNMLDKNILVTVGEGGDFTTINQAITYLVNNFSRKKHKIGDSTHSSRYTPDSLSATIKLLSGFVMREQVIIRQAKLGWINLISEDPEVVINRASLIKSAYFEGTASEMFPAFYAGDNSEQLLIACKFRMDNTGDGTNRHGYVCNRNSRGHIWSNCGINNAGGHGCFARESSSISCRITYFERAAKSGYVAASASSVNAQGGRCSGSFDGASAFGTSILNFERGEANNCRNDAVVSLSSSNVGCDYAELNNAGRYGIRAQDGGAVAGYQPSIKNSVNTSINCISGYVSTTRANLSGAKIGVTQSIMLSTA